MWIFRLSKLKAINIQVKIEKLIQKDKLTLNYLFSESFVFYKNKYYCIFFT